MQSYKAIVSGDITRRLQDSRWKECNTLSLYFSRPDVRQMKWISGELPYIIGPRRQNQIEQVAFRNEKEFEKRKKPQKGRLVWWWWLVLGRLIDFSVVSVYTGVYRSRGVRIGTMRHRAPAAVSQQPAGGGRLERLDRQSLGVWFV